MYNDSQKPYKQGQNRCGFQENSPIGNDKIERYSEAVFKNGQFFLHFYLNSC